MQILFILTFLIPFFIVIWIGKIERAYRKNNYEMLTLNGIRKKYIYYKEVKVIDKYTAENKAYMVVKGEDNEKMVFRVPGDVYGLYDIGDSGTMRYAFYRGEYIFGEIE